MKKLHYKCLRILTLIDNICYEYNVLFVKIKNEEKKPPTKKFLFESKNEIIIRINIYKYQIDRLRRIYNHYIKSFKKY